MFYFLPLDISSSFIFFLTELLGVSFLFFWASFRIAHPIPVGLNPIVRNRYNTRKSRKMYA